MRSGLIFLFFVQCCVHASAQHRDSILLREAVVYGIPTEKFLKGSVVQALDSSIRKNSISRHLGETLPLEFPIYFRNYGNGMLSTISLRGTAPEHTAVLWNGININSPSLGQADFSNLPAGGSYDVKVHAGGGSARFGSGAIGGTILLNSTDQSPALSVIQEVASFGTYYTSLQGSVNAGKWYLNTSGYWLQSKNDFEVQSTGEEQEHASYTLGGIQQQVRFQWDGAHQINLNYWYHHADRDIQPPAGRINNRDSTDEQQDENHRLSIQYKSNSRYGEFQATTGYVQDGIVYNNDPSKIHRWIATANHQFKLPGMIHAEVGASWNHIIGKLDEYEGGEAIEDRYDVMASLQKDVGKRLSLSLNIRQPYVSGYNAPFLPYLGGEYSLVDNVTHSLMLRASVSKNYRAPTLNERYWKNAGDKHLLPETSFATEAGVRWRWKDLLWDNTYFFQDVDEWIQWVQEGSTTNFRPQNVKRVHVNGFETRLRWQKVLHEFTFIPVISYQFVSSITREATENRAHTIGKQLMYSPRHIVASYLQLRYRKYSALVSMQFNGKRYTEPSNAAEYALDPFALVNFSIGRSWVAARHEFSLLGSVRNLFNEDYRLYSGRAVPGRNYSIQVTYHINHKKDEN